MLRASLCNLHKNLPIGIYCIALVYFLPNFQQFAINKVNVHRSVISIIAVQFTMDYFADTYSKLEIAKTDMPLDQIRIKLSQSFDFFHVNI